jgi:hypothetical protein
LADLCEDRFGSFRLARLGLKDARSTSADISVVDGDARARVAVTLNGPATDPARCDDDRVPAFGKLAMEVVSFARHPRSFVRRLTHRC